MTMTGLQVKELLERDLGFESFRAREVTEAAASADIMTYWNGAQLPALSTDGATGIARAALMAGTAGRSRLLDVVSRSLAGNSRESDPVEVATDIAAMMTEHQAVLNMSRSRASCVNAHLNVLNVERGLRRTYAGTLSSKALDSAIGSTQSLLKARLSSERDLDKWTESVHQLLSAVSADGDELGEDAVVERSSRKGSLSRRSLGTYRKQWEMFVREKLASNFSILLNPDDVSPLTEKLDALESGMGRGWSTIADEITRVRTDEQFKDKIAATIAVKAPVAKQSHPHTYELSLDGRPLEIQISAGVTPAIMQNFIRALRAQLVVHRDGTNLTVKLDAGNQWVSLEMQSANREDGARLAEMLVQLVP